MTFISKDEIKPFCPKVKDETLKAVVESTERLFCGLLPLEKKEREVSFLLHQIWQRGTWYQVNTSLLNIASAKNEQGESLTTKTIWDKKDVLLFEGKVNFYPVMTLKITSGYATEELPEDLKDAMISYATEQALMIGQGFWSNVASYKMWPRTISFRENSPVREQVMQTIHKYQL